MIDPNKPATIVLRVPQSKRAAYMAAAKPGKLAEWMVKTCDAAIALETIRNPAPQTVTVKIGDHRVPGVAIQFVDRIEFIPSVECPPVLGMPVRFGDQTDFGWYVALADDSPHGHKLTFWPRR